MFKLVSKYTSKFLAVTEGFTLEDPTLTTVNAYVFKICCELLITKNSLLPLFSLKRRSSSGKR